MIGRMRAAVGRDGQCGSTAQTGFPSIGSRCNHPTRSSDASARTRAAYRTRSPSSRRSCHWQLVPRLKNEGYDVTYLEFDGPHNVPAPVARAALEWLTR